MARQFERPRYPGLQREDPFADGRNPFKDQGPVPAAGTNQPAAGTNQTIEPADVVPAAVVDGHHVQTPAEDSSQAESRTPRPPDNLYAAPAVLDAGGPAAYRPGGYERTLAHRGRLILSLGVLALVLALLGGLGGLAAYTSGFGYQDAVLLSGLAPLTFLSLGASLPAVLMGNSDRRAMRAGAMDPAGRSRTNWGVCLALLSMLLSVSLVGLTLLAIIWQVMSDFGML